MTLILLLSTNAWTAKKGGRRTLFQVLQVKGYFSRFYYSVCSKLWKIISLSSKLSLSWNFVGLLIAPFYTNYIFDKMQNVFKKPESLQLQNY